MHAFVPTNVAAFNGVPVEPCLLARAERVSDLAPLLREAPDLGVIPRGGGRGFGDGALNRDGGVVGIRRLDRLLSFDPAEGIVECEAGCTIGKLIETFLPRGWFPLVTPGTKHVAVGGAIAADVHGKNHHRDGSFTKALIDFKLMLPSGEVLEVSRESHSDVFWATLGGMGLTGVILSARIRLRRVESGYLRVEYRRTPDLDTTLQLFADTDALTHYSVAWIDVLATGKSVGRCVLMLGSHLSAADVPAYAMSRPVDVLPRKERSLPFPAPRFALNKWTVKLFNARLYRRFADGVHVTDYDDYFYPLDRIANYPWLYGRQGFVQYQAVLPPDRSRDGLVKMLEAISSKGAGSFLAVLKSMGSSDGGMLSFPMPGHTLALDLPFTTALRPLIRDLDRIVLDHGGRVYLAKDAFLDRSSLEVMYPRLNEFLEVKRRLDPEGRIASSLAQAQSGGPGMTDVATEKHALITGAGSPIARSLAELLARAGWNLSLAGRDAEDLGRIASDLSIRFDIAAHVAHFDATADLSSHVTLFDECLRHGSGGHLQLLVICHGTIIDVAPDADATTRADAANRMMAVNFTGAATLIELAATHMERRDGGMIVGVSSVAADRPRKSIYAYGLSKAALAFHLEGVRHRLAKTPVRVLTVKPGFVDTRLTWGRPGMFLVASPDRVARAIFRAIVARRGGTIYAPWFWRWIMLVIRCIPGPIFRRLEL